MVLKRTEKAANFMSEAGRAIGGIAVIALAALVSYCALSRYFFDKPVYFTEEGSGFLLMLSLSLSFTYCFRIGKHVRMSVIVDRLPSKVKNYVELLADLVLFLYLVVFAKEAISYTFSAYQLGCRTETANLYLPPWLGAFCLSLLIFVIAVLKSLLEKGIRAVLLGGKSE